MQESEPPQLAAFSFSGAAQSQWARHVRPRSFPATESRMDPAQLAPIPFGRQTASQSCFRCRATISITRSRLRSQCSCTDFIEKLEQLLGAFRRRVFRKISSDWAAAWSRAILRAMNTSLPKSSSAPHSSTIMSAPIRDFHSAD